MIDKSISGREAAQTHGRVSTRLNERANRAIVILSLGSPPQHFWAMIETRWTSGAGHDLAARSSIHKIDIERTPGVEPRIVRCHAPSIPPHPDYAGHLARNRQSSHISGRDLCGTQARTDGRTDVCNLPLRIFFDCAMMGSNKPGRTERLSLPAPLIGEERGLHPLCTDIDSDYHGYRGPTVVSPSAAIAATKSSRTIMILRPTRAWAVA